MSLDLDGNEAIFKVLVNIEERRSLWPADLPAPRGWAETGLQGPKAECDEYLHRAMNG